MVIAGIIGVDTARSRLPERGMTSSRRTSLTSPLSTPPWDCTYGYDLIRVHALVWFLPDEFARVSMTLHRVMPPTNQLCILPRAWHQRGVPPVRA